MKQSYTLSSKDGSARRGTLHTRSGGVQTPLFMPIATIAALKGGIEAMELRGLGFEMLLSNTYHLHLRPGENLVKQFGGLAEFMHWDGPILTDSGGFQAYSLADINNLTEEGVTFKSHIDGAKVQLTPEGVVDIQHSLGIDIAMVLDECTPYPCSHQQAKDSMERSMRWAKRCRDHWHEKGIEELMHMFGIVQGSFFKDLREQSAKTLADLDLPGYAVGGVVVDFMRTPEALEASLPFLPEDKPRYLMGVGTPVDIINAVEQGIDMFDCVLPTRNGRHGKVYTSQGELNLSAAKVREDDGPIDPNCECQACKHYTRGYLRHLFTVNEMLGMRLATLHNLHFYGKMMSDIRASIEGGRYAAFKSDFMTLYNVSH